MRVLLVEPGLRPRAAEIDDSKEGQQKAIGGLTRVLCPWRDHAVLVHRDGGTELGLPANRAVINQVEEGAEVIKGPFFVCGLNDQGLASLNQVQLEKYYRMFQKPELILETEHGMCVYRCSEEEYSQAHQRSQRKDRQPKQKGDQER